MIHIFLCLMKTSRKFSIILFLFCSDFEKKKCACVSEDSKKKILKKNQIIFVIFLKRIFWNLCTGNLHHFVSIFFSHTLQVILSHEEKNSDKTWIKKVLISIKYIFFEITFTEICYILNDRHLKYKFCYLKWKKKLENWFCICSRTLRIFLEPKTQHGHFLEEGGGGVSTCRSL